MTLAERLAERRKEMGVSLQAVADALDVSKTLIFDLEKGRSTNPTLTVMLGLSQFYGVSLDELAGNITYQSARISVVRAFVSSDSIASAHENIAQYRGSILKLC